MRKILYKPEYVMWTNRMPKELVGPLDDAKKQLKLRSRQAVIWYAVKRLLAELARNS